MPQPTLDRATADALAERLKALREQRGLTQEEVAHAAGINRNHYQLLESGLSDRKKRTPANPRLSTLVRLSEVLGTEVPRLVADVFWPREGDPVVEVDPTHG